MTPPDLDLPNDVEMLKAMVLAMAEKATRVEALEIEVDDLKARNADADARIARLTQILKAFDRARFGRRSKKLGPASIACRLRLGSWKGVALACCHCRACESAVPATRR